MIYSIKRTSHQNEKTPPYWVVKIVREFAPSDELPTGKDGAMLRTQRHTSPGEIPRTSRQNEKIPPSRDVLLFW